MMGGAATVVADGVVVASLGRSTQRGVGCRMRSVRVGRGAVGRGRRLATGVLALLLVPATATAQTPEQAPELRGQLEDLGSEKQRIRQQLGQTVAREGDAREVLAAVSVELDDAEHELVTMEADLARQEALLVTAIAAGAAARVRLTVVEAARQVAELELAEKRDRLDARVRAAFKYGQISFLEAFVGTQDIAEFLNSSTYLSNVLEGDRELVEDVSGLLADVEQQRVEAQSLRAEAEREAAAADAATAEVQRATAEQQRLTVLIAERREEREQAMLALADDRAAIESHLAGLEAEGQRIGDQLAAIARQQAEEAERAAAAAREAEAAAQAAARAQAERDAAAAEQRRRDAASSGGDGTTDASAPPPASPPPADPPAPDPSAGSWTRPVGGHVTSLYGPRWGRNHNGVDLAGSVATTVVASRDGIVVHVTSSCHPTNSFGCGGGFGNYVTVAHADGFATIYAHLTAASVGTGQSVAAGQSVGTVGNSGSSYGAHLHFEVRVAGMPQNPCSYISC
jgi:murein DD-endopeptidase MepM/ murein hydrolase activator NlpD